MLNPTDLIASVIRTLTPMIAGAAVTWLATHNLVPDSQMQANLLLLLESLFGILYYILVRIAEHIWPKAGWLLLFPKTPSYGSGAALAPDTAPLEDIGSK